MIPGFPIPVITAAVSTGGFQMTAGDLLGLYYGYVSEQYAADALGSSAYETGTVTGDISADGGEVHLLATEPGASYLQLYILSGNQSATSLSINGVSYDLDYGGQETHGSNVYDTYEIDPFLGADFVPSATYSIEVT